MYQRERISSASTSESHRGTSSYKWLKSWGAYIRLRELDKSEAEKRRRCKAMDSSAMGLATPLYRRGGTFVGSLIPCSHGGRALVMKEAEEAENAEANSKYQDKAQGGVGGKDDREDGTIPKATKTIKDLLQVGVKFSLFRAKLLAFRKGMIRAAGELDCSGAHIRLRELDKSEDKAE
ncbi:hypothetical protein B296_00011634 [Ensete ventricosum]|uniref:Uncharacterized protein n=1 Tax=Ensete ventricosum TaxID=4639 RepID=A0A427AFV4_ENSVE|nr:hypothetical protein B296_00011634 [Ensete ventricosum]